MPVYDCGAPDCEECQRAFGPDRSKAIAEYHARERYYAELDSKKPMNPVAEEQLRSFGNGFRQ